MFAASPRKQVGGLFVELFRSCVGIFTVLALCFALKLRAVMIPVLAIFLQ